MTSREQQREQNIRQFYTELNKFGQAGEYEKAVKSANKSEILKINLWNLCKFVNKNIKKLIFQS